MSIRNKTCFFLLTAFLLNGNLLAETEVSVSAHVHSHISSGAKTISEISRAAKSQGVDAVILTDLLYERYDYGLKPFQDFLKASIKRPSIWDIGVPEYLRRIQEANQAGDGALMIDAAVVTPFYYWTGNAFPGPLVLNGRARDMIVFGFDHARDYETLPLTGTHTSGFSPYEGNKYSAPYQKVVEDVRGKGGMVFWSHPDANEHYEFKLWGTKVVLDSAGARDEVLETQGYTGIGVFSAELSEILAPHTKGLSGIGGVLDQVLMEYCQGRRKEPAWVLGEVDYVGVPSGQYIGGILNRVPVESLTREAILKAIGSGKSYLIIPSEPSRRRLELKDFSVSDGVSRAGMGQTLETSGNFSLHLDFSFSDQASESVRFVLIRDGKVFKEWDQTVPFQMDIADPEPPEGTSYYRLIASSQAGDRLLTNPVFVRRTRR